jgi:hypothetical protein
MEEPMIRVPTVPRPWLAVLLPLGCLLVVLAASPAGAADDEPDHADHSHTFIRITNAGLYPSEQALDKGEAFGWVNYSTKIAKVSFPAETAKKMTCTTRGSFRVNGDRLESGDIQATQFATLCNLAPGEYPYRVELRSGSGTSGEAPPVARDGKIIVK